MIFPPFSPPVMVRQSQNKARLAGRLGEVARNTQPWQINNVTCHHTATSLPPWGHTRSKYPLQGISYTHTVIFIQDSPPDLLLFLLLIPAWPRSEDIKRKFIFIWIRSTSWSFILVLALEKNKIIDILYPFHAMGDCLCWRLRKI